MSLTPEWRDCVWRERMLGVALCLAVIASGVAWGGVASSYIAEHMVYVAVVLIVLAMIALVRAAVFRCPRCGHTFSIRVGPGQFPDRKPSSRHCLHCWLPKWADPARLPVEAVLDENDDW